LDVSDSLSKSARGIGARGISRKAVRRTASLCSAYRGHPRLRCWEKTTTWMAGTSLAMTN